MSIMDFFYSITDVVVKLQIFVSYKENVKRSCICFCCLPFQKYNTVLHIDYTPLHCFKENNNKGIPLHITPFVAAFVFNSILLL